jgi:predicted ATPase
VIDAAARMAEALLRANPAVQVIATSREPLKTEGEWIHPVPPLTVPAGDAEDEDDPLQYGAVRLFIARAQAAEPHFVPYRRSAAMIAAVCRRLDGIPLAIELAAARVVALGIEEVAARLDDRFLLLTGGRRTALPRHQTLRATLDWSYELLPEPERMILRRLAVFAGPFALEAPIAVVASPQIAPSEVVDGLSNLVAKSLVAAKVNGATACSIRRGPTRSKSWARAANANGSRVATQDITATASSRPKPNGRRGQQPNGRPNTGCKSTTCAPRLIGHFRRMAIRRSAWRSPPPQCRSGCTCR